MVVVLVETEATSDSDEPVGVLKVYVLARIVCNTTGNCALGTTQWQQC